MSNISLAQLTKKEILSNAHNDCTRTKNLSFNKLAKLFPLNKATSILIISFENQHVVYLDSIYKEPKLGEEGLPYIDKKLNYKKIKETIKLNFNQTTELSDLLYNTKPNPEYARKNTKML